MRNLLRQKSGPNTNSNDSNRPALVPRVSQTNFPPRCSRSIHSLLYVSIRFTMYDSDCKDSGDSKKKGRNHLRSYMGQLIKLASHN